MQKLLIKLSVPQDWSSCNIPATCDIAFLELKYFPDSYNASTNTIPKSMHQSISQVSKVLLPYLILEAQDYYFFKQSLEKGEPALACFNHLPFSAY